MARPASPEPLLDGFSARSYTETPSPTPALTPTTVTADVTPSESPALELTSSTSDLPVPSSLAGDVSGDEASDEYEVYDVEFEEFQIVDGQMVSITLPDTQTMALCGQRAFRSGQCKDIKMVGSLIFYPTLSLLT